PYTSMECGKSCRDNSNLLSHQHIHTRERPYLCRECAKSFTKSSHLICHHPHQGMALHVWVM
ncbi:ZSC20 protein, partial [Sclerurus mexicanus]|nr:ZSC20 protein [Sclerurus mexicanus]NXF74683.1 ZSC20 protein [Sclerurus mexicanus]